MSDAEQPASPATPEPAGPPVAERRPVTSEHHGHHRTDDYEWLRAKDDPEVLAHLEAENAWTAHRTAHLAGLRETLFDEIRSRTRETDLSVPTRIRDHWHYSRSYEGREYGAACRVPVASRDDWTPPQPAEDCSPDEPALPGEEVLLDLNALAEGHDFFSLGGMSISLDDTLLAYATDTTGDERYTVRVKELATGQLRDEEITGVLGGVTWAPDSRSFYYCTVDDSWRPDKVWRHRLGTDQSDDVLVHHETDPQYWTGVGRSRSNRFLVIAGGSRTTTEYRVLDFGPPDAPVAEPEPQVFHPRQEGLEYHLEHAVLDGRDVFLVHHNATGPDFEIGVSGLAPCGPDSWQPLIPHDPEVRLEDVDAFAGHVVVHQRSAGLTQLRILDLGSGSGSGSVTRFPGVTDDHLVEFDDEVFTVGAGSSPMFDQPVVRLGYTTLAVPPSVYDYDVRSRTLTLLRRTPVLGGYDPEEYAEHRLWATAPDGEEVPISLVVRHDAVRDGRPVPLHLYGYGSYEASMDPWFSISRLSLLDRGAAFAVAHVRGGGEMGRRWYDAGKLQHKENTFTDFIACAEHLVATGWTTSDRLVAEGGSAGGLLVGAVANRAPGAFGGIVAQVPFVDILTTMLDSSLPLTTNEYQEWGNPEDDPEAYRLIAGYAPYDNVVAQDYPPILAEASLHDTRVLYVEAAKWVARLRATATGSRDVLLKTEMAAGHGGVSGRYQSWRDRAFTMAWILDRMGLSDPGRPS